MSSAGLPGLQGVVELFDQAHAGVIELHEVAKAAAAYCERLGETWVRPIR